MDARISDKRKVWQGHRSGEGNGGRGTKEALPSLGLTDGGKVNIMLGNDISAILQCVGVGNDHLDEGYLLVTSVWQCGGTFHKSKYTMYGMSHPLKYTKWDVLLLKVYQVGCLINLNALYVGCPTP